ELGAQRVADALPGVDVGLAVEPDLARRQQPQLGGGARGRRRRQELQSEESRRRDLHAHVPGASVVSIFTRTASPVRMVPIIAVGGLMPKSLILSGSSPLASRRLPSRRTSSTSVTGRATPATVSTPFTSTLIVAPAVPCTRADS